MSELRPHPTWLAELRRAGSSSLVVPLTLPAPFGAGRHVSSVQQDLQKAIADSWMEEGDYSQLISDGAGMQPEVVPIEVELPEVEAVHGGAMGSPAMKLQVPGAIARVASGWMVFLPSLRVQAWGADQAQALEAGRKALRDYVARHNLRLNARALAGLTWWTSCELHEVQLMLPRFTFHERRERALARERQSGRQLDRCASPMPAAVAFELEAVRADLRRAVLARVGAGVLVVGPVGSGKTALIADEVHAKDTAFRALGEGRGEAGRVAWQQSPVWTTTAARLEHSLTREGPWQASLARLCRELQREGVWLHVANLADLFEVGRYEGNDTSMGEYLRPWLGRGDIALISECTPEQKATLEARYPGFLEHLVQVDNPAPDEAAHTRVVMSFLRHHAATGQGTFEMDAGDEAIRLQRRFVPYSGFPGRTLRFLAAIAESVPPPVQRRHVLERFCEESGIPRAFVDPAVALPHAELQHRFEAALYGQPEAVKVLVDVATAIKADVAPRGRPIASLLFTGPTGVGKTEAARVLASVLFGSRERMVRFDMSEFATPAAVMQLTSSPDPHGEGRLTGAVRRQPFAVVLLDEVEKAHPDFFDLLLQVLGEGRLTDHRGQVADFCSTIVVMTSNLGADLALRTRVGIGRMNELPTELKDAVHRALRPELVNRLDRLVPFTPLSREAVLRVLDRELQALARHRAISERAATLTVSDAVREHLATAGHDPARGARPLQRVLRDQVISRLAVALDAAPQAPRPALEVELGEDGQVMVSLTPRQAPASAPPLLGRISTTRRELQQVIRGETFEEHGSAWLLALRSARSAAEAGRFGHIDSRELHHLPAPLNELRSCLDQALALESSVLVELSRAAAQGPASRSLAEQEGALAEIERRAARACRALCHAVHPLWGTGYLALWAPSDERNPVVHGWARWLVELAEQLEIAVEHREVWLVHEVLKDVDVDEPRPRDASKWAGVELWLEGEAAAPLLAGAEGLFLLGTPDEARCRVMVAVPQSRQVPSCCDGVSVGMALMPAPRGVTIYQRFVAPRPSNILRRAAFEGKALPWPPFEPQLGRYHRAIWHHLVGQPMVQASSTRP